jgi:hypothetical protein
MKASFTQKFDAVYQNANEHSRYKSPLSRAPAYNPTVTVSRVESPNYSAGRKSYTSEIGLFLVPTRSAKDLIHLNRYESLIAQKSLSNSLGIKQNNSPARSVKRISKDLLEPLPL